MKTHYRGGDRIRLVERIDAPDPIPAGTTRIVVKIYPQRGWGQLDIQWGNGRSLMLSIPPDEIERIESPKDAPSC